MLQKILLISTVLLLTVTCGISTSTNDSTLSTEKNNSKLPISYDQKNSNLVIRDKCPEIFKDRVHSILGYDFLRSFTKESPWNDCRHDRLDFYPRYKKNNDSFRAILTTQNIEHSIGRGFEHYNGSCLQSDLNFKTKLKEKSAEKIVNDVDDEDELKEIF